MRSRAAEAGASAVRPAALAAPRPRARCRREDYDRFAAIWRVLHPGQFGADAMDAQLHAERVADDRAHQLHEIPIADLPDGAFVLDGCRAALMLGNELLTWTPAGYQARNPRPGRGRVLAMTPPSLVAVLRSGWESALTLWHPSALVSPR